MPNSTNSVSTKSASPSISPRLTNVNFELVEGIVIDPKSGTSTHTGLDRGTCTLDLRRLEESARDLSLAWLRGQYPVSGFDEKNLKCVTQYNGNNQRRIRLTVGAGPKHCICDEYDTRCNEHTALYIATTDWLPREDCDVLPYPGNSNAASESATTVPTASSTTVLHDPGPSTISGPKSLDTNGATHLDNDATTADGVTVKDEASAGESNTVTSVASVSQGEGRGSSRGDRYKKRFNRLYQMTRMKRGKVGSSVGTQDEGS